VIARQGYRPGTLYKRAVLIDTGPLYALADPRDNRHAEAIQCLSQITRLSFPLFLTNLTIAETHRRILHSLGIQRGLAFLASVHDGNHNIVRPEESDDTKARDILNRYQDHHFSFTDGVCFAVMLRLGIVRAFSFDKHFQVMGFLCIPPLETLAL
jgi:predicted nucleic acid-binding protein